MSYVVPPESKSWIEVPAESHFPIQNLPFGQFVHPETDLDEIGIRIGDQAVVLTVLRDAGLVEGLEADRFLDLTDLASHAEDGTLTGLRRQVADLLHVDNPVLRDDPILRRAALVPTADLEMLLPVYVRGFVDFYSGIHHASNVGRMFRPDQPPLLPNYRHVPVAYNGRASSVMVSGEPLRRPWGQTKGPSDPAPSFQPTQELDFELEMGFVVGQGNELGLPIPISSCEAQILGLVVVNDWSARDIQRWEYQPLGPLLAKSFGTSVSPWLVTLDALEPFRTTGEPQDPPPMPHLVQPGPGHFDIVLEVAIQSERMKSPQTVCRSNTRHLYWTVAQQLAHLTSNGCNVEPGDLCASGTISGPEPGSFGSMLELAWKGERPIVLEESGESRAFLEDGDTVVMSAYAQSKGFRVGFGEVRSTVLPSLPPAAWEFQ